MKRLRCAYRFKFKATDYVQRKLTEGVMDYASPRTGSRAYALISIMEPGIVEYVLTHAPTEEQDVAQHEMVKPLIRTLHKMGARVNKERNQ